MLLINESTMKLVNCVRGLTSKFCKVELDLTFNSTIRNLYYKKNYVTNRFYKIELDLTSDSK
jgi:hypothetical protein